MPIDPLYPSFLYEKAGNLYRFSEELPVGLRLSVLNGQADPLHLTLPATSQEGLVLTFIHYKGELTLAGDKEFSVSPGLGMLSLPGRPMEFRSASPIHFSAVIVFIPRGWVDLFMKDNANFNTIDQALGNEGNILTCRMGRRQLAIFSSILEHQPGTESNLLEVQNRVLSLLEYFLCHRHQDIPGSHSAIENEEDLTLIREVESYISEYYCSDTFTVDSILKKTYTSYHKLNFLFKSIHGMTISEYIRNKRIEKSKEMIAANAKSISQIAYEIGYSSISNYILAFKKIYRITPGKYKKQIET